MTDNELDILWSRRVKERAGYRCEFCNEKGVESHHVFGRGLAVRWDLNNGLCLCVRIDGSG